MKKINHKIIIKEIENIRKKNNEQWMKIMSIAFDYAPKKAGNVLKKINSNDMKISVLVSKLANQ